MDEKNTKEIKEILYVIANNTKICADLLHSLDTGAWIATVVLILFFIRSFF